MDKPTDCTNSTSSSITGLDSYKQQLELFGGGSFAYGPPSLVEPVYPWAPVVPTDPSKPFDFLNLLQLQPPIWYGTLPVICPLCLHAFDNTTMYNDHIESCKKIRRRRAVKRAAYRRRKESKSKDKT